jgi:hypothetical protein
MPDNDIGRYATEIFEDTFGELMERAALGLAGLSEPDRDAVIAAVGKAAWMGILRGLAMQAHQANERLREEAEKTGEDAWQIDVDLQLDPFPDVWAQRYGGGS